jgi:hypothetical protein
MRRYPWMVDVVRQRPVSILHPYMVEVYVASGRLGGVSLVESVEGVLCKKRSSEGSQARAGVQADTRYTRRR